MRCGGKSAHVDAEFGGNHLCAEFTDSRDGCQQFDGSAKGFHARVRLPVNLADDGVEGIDLLKMQPQQERWCITTQPCSASRSCSGGALMRGWARAASLVGSVSPAIRASIILLPVGAMMSEI